MVRRVYDLFGEELVMKQKMNYVLTGIANHLSACMAPLIPVIITSPKVDITKHIICFPVSFSLKINGLTTVTITGAK